MRRWLIAAIGACALAGAGCDDGGGGDDDAGADTGSSSGLGAIEVTGNWDGAVTDDAGFRVAVFPCPFSMPPEYFAEGDYDAASGDVHALVSDVEPGEWCLMAYVDMDPEDGLAPAEGIDAINDTGDENSNGALAVDVVAGETTPLDLSFAI